ncbi:MAG: protein kinase [Candidatus Obscuribacterales bacterium]|nr:protein kinase [Candidatus Obscuribacterales bacterium]
MTESDICPTCQRQKKTGNSGGFFTQLIDICLCDSLARSQFSTITVCADCGKRIPGREGSITQWVFRDGSCECARPQPVEKSIDSFVQPTFEGFREDREEKEISLTAEEFPVDRYKAVAILGHGSTGTVYLCRDRLLDKKVAVKTLLNLNADQLVSFQEEARATARFNHPNIVTVLDFGATDSGVPYMVMDYIPGISLESHIQTYGPLDEESAGQIFYCLAQALDYAHEQGIYHRDIKPSNIILFETESGIDLRLIDFGIAKVKEVSGLSLLYQEKTLAGTPLYMAPDTVRGLDYDRRSEVYSLGCVIFESLTGQPPFTGETPIEVISNHANLAPPSLQEIIEDAGDEMEEIVSKCLAKEKAERYQSMKELGEALQEAAISNAAETTHPQKGTAKPKQHTNGLYLPYVAGLISVTLAGAGVAWLMTRPDSTATKTEQTAQSPVRPIQDVSYFTSATGESKPSLVERERGNFIVQGLVKQGKESLLFLTDNKNIEFLEFSQDDLRGETLAPLSTLPALKGLTISFCEIDRETVASIGKLKTLKMLAIENSPVEDSAFKLLTGLANIQDLSFWGVPGEDAVLQNLSTLKTTRFLALRNGSHISDKGIEHLAALPYLYGLSLTGTPLSQKNIKALKRLKNLKGLELSEFNNEIADSLKKMNLESLRIANNKKLTDKDLMPAAKIKSLKYLHIKKCEKVTPALKTYFRSAAANVQVNIKGTENIAPIPVAH